MFTFSTPPIQEIHEAFFLKHQIRLYIKRLDLLHPVISGNKWFKLKYNLIQAKKENLNTLLTFGGAFSNHIVATAFAGKQLGFNTIGIIRGEETSKLNPSLKFANECNMKLHFISREAYRKKKEKEFLENLNNQYGPFYLIPEGGSNAYAVKGCSEIIDQEESWNIIACACGTGGTLAGILSNLRADQKAYGFSALKGGEFLKNDIEDLIQAYAKKEEIYLSPHNFHLETKYHFGGYAKRSQELKSFVKDFYEKHQIQLDYIYTSKMMFGLYDLIKKNHFKKKTTILAIHTGGIQGNEGFLSQ